MTMNDMVFFALSLLAFVVAALYFKYIPNDYPEFHKKYPYRDYYGLKIHFHGIEFNKKNWTYLKMIGFKSSIVAGVIHFFISVLYLTLNSFVFHEPITKKFFSGSATILGVFALFYLLMKFCKYDDNN